MHLLIQCFFLKTQFLYRILLGFWHFESRRISPNLNPKFCFQPRCGQAAMWSEVSSGGTAPTARDGHAAVWSEAANGMYIFGGSPVLGAAARKRWRVPQPKDGRSCAEASSTTCISLTARPPERTEVGEASEQFPFGFARLWYFNCFETGETSNISCHQPCHFASYFFVSIPFFPKQFTVGVLNATLDLAALLLVGVVGFLGSEVVLSPVVSGCLPSCGGWVLVGVAASRTQIFRNQNHRFQSKFASCKLFGVYAGVITTLLALCLRNLVNMVLCIGGPAWVALQCLVSFRTHFGQGSWSI